VDVVHADADPRADALLAAAVDQPPHGIDARLQQCFQVMHPDAIAGPMFRVHVAEHRLVVSRRGVESQALNVPRFAVEHGVLCIATNGQNRDLRIGQLIDELVEPLGLHRSGRVEGEPMAVVLVIDDAANRQRSGFRARWLVGPNRRGTRQNDTARQHDQPHTKLPSG